MAGKDIISMTQGELKRLHIVRKALDRSITQAEAANIIGRCLRQVRRIVKRVKREGAILKFKEITIRPEKIDQPKPYLPRQVYIPPADHPWRRFKINPQFPQYEQKEKGSQKEKELLLIET